MLASPADLDSLRYPLFASPKLDGIRAACVGGRLLSRTLKEIPSRYIYNMFNQAGFDGLDGELIVGPPTSPTCYRNTVSGVMADHKMPDFKWYVFDQFKDAHLPFSGRRTLTEIHLADLQHKHIVRVEHVQINNRDELDDYEAEQVNLGHEGIMLNDPDAKYKFGRATVKGGELLKVKRFVDAEAVIIGMEEEMFNGNEAETNELGRTKRSTAKDGLVGKGTMGALIVRDVTTGIEFNIGTGFTAADRSNFWFSRKMHLQAATPIKYKHFPIGGKDKPRHPVFLGFRPLGA